MTKHIPTMPQTTKARPSEKQKDFIVRFAGYSPKHADNISRGQAGFIIRETIDQWIQRKADRLYARIKDRRNKNDQGTEVRV